MIEGIEQALRMKNRARTAREDEEYDRAVSHIEEARRQLEALWAERGTAIDEAGAGAGSEERALVDALAEVHGIRGGIYRSLKNYEEAIKAYDSGLRFEAHPARSADSSYNLVQRLTNRVLLRPAEIGVPGWIVERLDMGEELRNAARTLREQLQGSRARDPWAAADLVFLELLLVSDPWQESRIEEAWSALQALKPRSFVYESTRRTLEDLRGAMEGVAAAQRSAGWKRVAEWLDRLIERFGESETRANTG